MFKQPLCYVTAKVPMIKALSPEGLKDKAITQLLAKTQAHHYLANDKIRASLLSLMILGKYRAVDPVYHLTPFVSKYHTYPHIAYGVLNHKLNSLNDPKFNELVDLVLKDEKKDLLFLEKSPKLIANSVELRNFKDILISRMPKNYDLAREIDNIIGDTSKLDEKSLREFLESLKLSRRISPKMLAEFIKEKYFTPYKVIEREQTEINISGEKETKIIKEYKYNTTVDVNNINEDIFTNENIFELIIAYTNFAPIEHLEVLNMHLQENITKTFLNEKRLALLTALLKRLSLEKNLISTVIPLASKINRKNDIRFKGSNTIISPGTFFEVSRDEKLAEKFRIQLISSILHNPDLDVQVVQEYFKENQILDKKDLLQSKHILRSRFPDMVQNPDKYTANKPLNSFTEVNDIQIMTHDSLIKEVSPSSL